MRGLKPKLGLVLRIWIVSHLLQMRGLKPINEYGYETLRSRIFYRCVDWNRNVNAYQRYLELSHLLQMRGLKHPFENEYKRNQCRIFYRCVDWNGHDVRTLHTQDQSHLLQMRGLKQLINYQSSEYDNVASFTDAWIETDWLPSPGGIAKVASFTDAWIETALSGLVGVKSARRIFYRCVDWNY